MLYVFVGKASLREWIED